MKLFGCEWTRDEVDVILVTISLAGLAVVGLPALSLMMK